MTHPIDSGIVASVTSGLHAISHGITRSRVPVSLFTVINNLGLTSNLQLCLDAGDNLSYDPATQTDKWLDRSVNGYDFYLGTGTGADAADPTFNGTAGRLSSGEFWSFDGGDVFTYDTTNETWMQNLHKDNAAFTILAWTYNPGAGTLQGYCGTRGAQTSNTGIMFSKNTADGLRFAVQNAGAAVTGNIDSTATLGTGWHFVAIGVNEATAAGTFQVNATQDSFSSTYTSPAAGNASFTMQIGSQGNANNPLVSGARIAEFAAWSSKLTDANLTSIYNATKGRFGL